MNQLKIDLFRHKRDEINNVLDNQDIIRIAETWTTQGEEILLWDDPSEKFNREGLRKHVRGRASAGMSLCMPKSGKGPKLETRQHFPLLGKPKTGNGSSFHFWA